MTKSTLTLTTLATLATLALLPACGKGSAPPTTAPPTKAAPTAAASATAEASVDVVEPAADATAPAPDAAPEVVEAAAADTVAPTTATPDAVETATADVVAGAPVDDADLTKVVDAYIRGGGAGGDLTKSRELVDAACKDDEKVWSVDAAVVLGLRLQISDVKVANAIATGDRTSVDVTVVGAAKADKTSADTTVLGAKVKIDVGHVDLGTTELTTPLTLVKRDGKWRVTCAAAP